MRIAVHIHVVIRIRVTVQAAPPTELPTAESHSLVIQLVSGRPIVRNPVQHSFNPNERLIVDGRTAWVLLQDFKPIQSNVQILMYGNNMFAVSDEELLHLF